MADITWYSTIISILTLPVHCIQMVPGWSTCQVITKGTIDTLVTFHSVMQVIFPDISDCLIIQNRPITGLDRPRIRMKSPCPAQGSQPVSICAPADMPGITVTQ